MSDFLVWLGGKLIAFGTALQPSQALSYQQFAARFAKAAPSRQSWTYNNSETAYKLQPFDNEETK